MSNFEVVIPHPPYEPTTPISEACLCPVCFVPFYLPKVLPCGHTICNGCIERLHKAECPMCRLPYHKTSDNYTLRDMVEGVPVKCGNAGCSFVGRIGSMESHFNECEYGTKVCIDCGEPIPTRGVRRHRCHPDEVAQYGKMKEREIEKQQQKQQELQRQQRQELGVDSKEEGPGALEVVLGVGLVALGALAGFFIGKAATDKPTSAQPSHSNN
eukprot:PhF_6_TR41614/c0_g1_i1/m.63069/K11981/RNF41, NRDP1; E3 ubiquitin-protein ligase NRDP1